MVILILGIGNIHVFFMYNLQTLPNGTDTFCMVVNPEYQFATWILIPWIDMTVFAIVPSLLIVLGNISIIYKLVKAGVRRTDMVQGNTNKNAHYKIIPMLLLVSTFFVATSLPICIYFIGKMFHIS